jgi:hypothetical protein
VSSLDNMTHYFSFMQAFENLNLRYFTTHSIIREGFSFTNDWLSHKTKIYVFRFNTNLKMVHPLHVTIMWARSIIRRGAALVERAQIEWRGNLRNSSHAINFWLAARWAVYSSLLPLSRSHTLMHSLAHLTQCFSRQQKGRCRRVYVVAMITSARSS